MSKAAIIDAAFAVAANMRPDEVRGATPLQTLAWQILQLERAIMEGTGYPFRFDTPYRVRFPGTSPAALAAEAARLARLGTDKPCQKNK